MNYFPIKIKDSKSGEEHYIFAPQFLPEGEGFRVIETQCKVPMKQVIVIRKDLNMRKGKMVAQGAHASMAAAVNNLSDERVSHWLSQSFTKIVVGVDSLEEFDAIYENAIAKGLICAKIVDNGATEFNGIKTLTALAIGPDYTGYVDEVTKGLKLL